LWNDELKDAQRKGRRPRLRNAFIKFLGLHYLMLGILPFLEVRAVFKISCELQVNATLQKKTFTCSSGFIMYHENPCFDNFNKPWFQPLYKEKSMV